MLGRKKLKPNEWLENGEYLDKIDFYDRYYLEALCRHLANYLKSVPISVLSTWDAKNTRIYLNVGSNKKFFKVDTKISYWDFITLCKRWLTQFFPQYHLAYESEESLPEDEVWVKVKEENIPIDEALQLTKIVDKVEQGILKKIMLKNDEFIFDLNGEETVRMSGKIQNPIPLSAFLKYLRPDNNRSAEEIKEYIFENSIEVRKLDANIKDIFVDYPGTQMVNFFKINYPDLLSKELVELEDRLYKWGKFKIKFESNLVCFDCLSFAEDKGIKVVVRE